MYKNKFLVNYLVVLSAVLLLGVLQEPEVTAFCENIHRSPSAPYTPPLGRALLIIGQDLGAIGGLKNYEEGYTDNINILPSGLTTYTNLIDLEGLETTANWGAGDINANELMQEAKYLNSVLSIGLWLNNSNLFEIPRGLHDDNILRLAEWIKEQKRPVFLRIGYEFDGAWNGYDPDRYVATWRYIVDKFETAEVNNYATVWQSATYRQNDWINWYPGNEYVDWFGISYFEPNHSVIENFLNMARCHHKPIMIAEATPRGFDLQEVDGELVWDSWFAPFFQFIYHNNDVVRAVSYINVDWNSQSMWANEGLSLIHI